MSVNVGGENPRNLVVLLSIRSFDVYFFALDGGRTLGSMVSLPPQYLSNLVYDIMMPAWRQVTGT